MKIILPGSITIADDGTETKIEAAGRLYDIIKATTQAALAKFGQALPDGAEGKPIKAGLADIANDHAEWLATEAEPKLHDYGVMGTTTVTLDLHHALAWTVTLNGNVFIDAVNLVAGASCVLHILQDATGGYGVGWDAKFKFRAGSTDDDATLTADAHDVYVMTCDGTNLYVVAAPKDLV